MIKKINEGEEMQKTKIKNQQTKPNQKDYPFYLIFSRQKLDISKKLTK